MRCIVDTAAARSRLEAMLADLDRSIAILRGETPSTTIPRPMPAPVSPPTTASRRRWNPARHRAGVAAALERLGAGSYGRCVDCGEAVPEGRLEARPDAARCITCQARHDRPSR